MNAALRCSLVAISLCTATGFVVTACNGPDLKETLGEKSEWSLLQAVEHQERQSKLAEPIVKTINGSKVLGVRSVGGNNIWLLLNVQSPPYYKQLPEGNYEISREFLSALKANENLSYTVSHVLESHIPE